jgi:hypothetical protein
LISWFVFIWQKKEHEIKIKIMPLATNRRDITQTSSHRKRASINNLEALVEVSNESRDAGGF